MFLKGYCFDCVLSYESVKGTVETGMTKKTNAEPVHQNGCKFHFLPIGKMSGFKPFFYYFFQCFFGMVTYLFASLTCVLCLLCFVPIVSFDQPFFDTE